jgi:hypothetical protein
MRLSISIFPLEIIEKYQLTRLAVDGWVYLEICKGMYGLKQAGILANTLLQKRLKPFGYHPARHTPCIWLHTTEPTAFSLVVDSFAIKYVTEADAHHLRNALLQHYEITTDWGGTVDSGITFKGTIANVLVTFPCPAISTMSLIITNMTHPALYRVGN